ncbi:MAG: hypothetical protein WC209_12885 [Ignavibacteriaceae bacterium]|jgi:ribosomal protein L37AE/L43A
MMTEIVKKELLVEIYCPRCTNMIAVRDGIKILSCHTCGLVFKVESNKKIQQFFYRLWSKIKSILPNWFITNWSKIITKVESIIISETIVYSSHCWYCTSPIKSVKTSVKQNHYFKYKISELWLGNKKCQKTNCKYFLCNDCGRCLCDYQDIILRKAAKDIEQKWMESNPKDITLLN